MSEFVNNKHIPNLILSGGPGVGKTTVAKAMLDEIGATYMMINGSEESGIDVLRTKIKNFASTVSLEGGRKYIILDEADYLNRTIYATSFAWVHGRISQELWIYSYL